MTKGEILVVDDEPASVHHLKRQLKRSGYTVGEARSGEEALLLPDRKPYDAVVADILMGDGMSGLHLLEALHERDPELPVILITAAPTVEGAAASIAERACAYLAKPVDVVEMLAGLEECIGRHRALLAGEAHAPHAHDSSHAHKIAHIVETKKRPDEDTAKVELVDGAFKVTVSRAIVWKVVKYLALALATALGGAGAGWGHRRFLDNQPRRHHEAPQALPDSAGPRR